MAKKTDSSGGKLISVAVVGLSGTEKEKGQIGIGKSCLCNRFVRLHADDYNVDHISVLSQSDFSGRVVNNDHFLYWGSVTREYDDSEYRFEVVEQTEFIDDACFQPFKAGKMEPYTKRCTATKLQSAEKMMYVCKNQLGIEKEYEQKLLPDGRLSIDGFVCVYDVSGVPGRSWDKKNDFTAAILVNILKLKKPVILVTSKNDEASEMGVREAERLLQRKELKGTIPLVETSSHDNVNVEQAFILLAHMVDKAKNRIKVAPYHEALRQRREKLDFITESFTQLIRAHVVDHKDLWSSTSKRLSQHPEWIRFVEQFGRDGTQVVFGRHIRRLKEERQANKLRKQLARLPQVLSRLQLNTQDLTDNDWPMVVRQLRAHRDFTLYFTLSSDRGGHSSGAESPLAPDGTLPVGERGKRYQTLGGQHKIPYEILDSAEADSIFRNFLQDAQEEHRNQDMCQQFKRLLEETPYVTPGKQLSEVRVLLMGRECFEALSERQQQKVYDMHQRQLQKQAKHNFQELLLEHADLFYHFKNLSPAGTITQEDIKEITDVLQDDSRYKMLDRMEQDRKLVLFQHLGFVHCPMREHCPAGQNCLDSSLSLLLNTRVGTLTSSGQASCAAPWAVTPDSHSLSTLILAVDNLAEEFGKGLIAACDADRSFTIDGHTYSIDYRTVSGDFNTTEIDYNEFAPNGYLCVFQDQESFEYIRECAEKTLLSSLEQEDRLPFQGLPLVVVFIQDDNMDKKELMRLQEEGQNLADNLHCGLVEAGCGEVGARTLAEAALGELLRANATKAQAAHLYRDPPLCLDSDIRIMVCMFCGDPYSPERVLSPLLSHQNCLLSGERSVLIQTFLGDSKRHLEIIISSFHGANQFREELIHGFILIYSAKRKASLASLNAFSMNIPNLPIQVVAVTEGAGGSASAFFSTELGHTLITEGNALADRLNAHFTTYAPGDKSAAFYTAFFLEVWEKKEEIERAFRMDEPPDLPDLASHRQHYMNNHKLGHKLTNSLDLLIGPESREDSEYSDSLNNKNRGFMKGFSVYPPPSTPPEPAPPDHHLSHGGAWAYGGRSYTTGRRPHPLAQHHQSHTLKQQPPGKLDMNNFTIVNDALQHVTISGHHNRDRKRERTGHPPRHHPSGVSSETELDAHYAQIKEGNEYTEPSTGRTRRHRRYEKNTHHPPPRESSRGGTTGSGGGGSESDSSAASSAGPPRRQRHHHRAYKKRSLGNLVAVQSPRVPKLGMFVGPPELPTGYTRRNNHDKGSESSDNSSEETRRVRPLPPVPSETHKMLSAGNDCQSPAQDNSTEARRRHQSGWSNKNERRHKESKSKDKKNSNQQTNLLQNFGPQGPHGVPLFVEKCIEFIEHEGLALEGLYRVPGNRAHVELLFKKFTEDPQVEFHSLDVPVNAVATALKDFFSKKLPPLFDDDSMQKLEDIAAMRCSVAAGGVELKDRSWRLLALRQLLHTQLTPDARATLDYMFAHFTRVAENSKLNSMDSKNLAICWWPTLLPVQFHDMARFEMTRPYLEDVVQTMIDQYPFLFRGQEAAVMV